MSKFTDFLKDEDDTDVKETESKEDDTDTTEKTNDDENKEEQETEEKGLTFSDVVAAYEAAKEKK